MTDLFDGINNLFTKKDEEMQISDVYMTNRFLSMHPVSFSQSFFVNTIASRLSKEEIDSLLRLTIPKMKFAPKIFYRKRAVSNLPAKEREDIKLLSEIFHCSEHYSEQIFQLLKKQKVSIKKLLGEKKRRGRK